jgi:hypothetical protein
MWDTSGNLITRINAYIQWYWFLEEMPIEKIGLLPKDPDVFYAYTSLPGWGCNVFLVDINSGEYNRIEVTDTVGYKHNCAIPLLTELDLSEVTLKAGILKYRIEADTDVWGDWKEVPVEEPRVPNTVILN